MNAWVDLQWRGLVYDASQGAAEALAQEPVTVYVGFDPTAASLHVGSLLPILCLARAQRRGHTPIALVGGGTGLIGDPSGKSQERLLLSREQVEANLWGIGEQLRRFLDFDAKSNPARLVNNADWLTAAELIEFLRDIGKHFTVNYMLAKESVQRRLEQDEGISYTEFSYLLLQAYDFLMLHDRYGCNFQMGGSDQWGNITAGTELIRKLRRTKAYGLVFPLLTTASGKKFGKTEAGTVWLDAAMTSPYLFYQFWLNTADVEVISYLKFFTWLSQEDVAGLAAELQSRPEERSAQKRLAREVTALVHGETACARAIRSSEVLFGGALDDFGSAEILEIFANVPHSALSPAAFAGAGQPLPELLVATDLLPSKGAARRLIREGGVYLNNRRIADERFVVTADQFVEGRVLLLRKGQKTYHLVTLPGEARSGRPNAGTAPGETSR